MLSRRFDADVQSSSRDFYLVSHQDVGLFLTLFKKLTQCRYTLKSRLYGSSKEINNGAMAKGFCVTRDCPRISSVIRDSAQICDMTQKMT